MKYKPTIGLEIHIEINTASKMFCSCFNDSGANEPNKNICPVCSGQPGSLPVTNKKAIEKIIKTGLALGCDIPRFSKFDRKKYFYPDLPKGYQISQYDQPFCLNGYLKVGKRKIKLERIHLEEDAGKLVHPVESSKKNDFEYSLVDLNRAGAPLMELVTKPDIFSASEARKFLEELQLTLRYLEVSNADMEKGELRADANISLSLDDSKKLGTKVEVKNLNSFRSIEKSINYEIERQTGVLEKGGTIIQETMGWEQDKEITFIQRSKEESDDYRYFPEPDIPLFDIEKSTINIKEIKSTIKELPFERKERFKNEYNLPEKEINFLIYEKKLGDYYEEIISELDNWIKEIDIKNKVSREEHLKLSKMTSNYLLSDLWGYLKKYSDRKIPITAENFAEFISLIYKNKISSKIAKTVLKEMFETGKDPSAIIKEKDLTELSSESEIEEIIENVVFSNQKAVEDFKNGKEASFQFLVGQVMAKTKGKANPAIVGKILKEKLIK